jgi:hypothetical protein
MTEMPRGDLEANPAFEEILAAQRQIEPEQ